jgi:hypothetical protein
MIRPPVAVLPPDSPSSKQDERAKGIMNLALLSDFMHAVKSYDMWPPALLPPEGRRAEDIYRP